MILVIEIAVHTALVAAIRQIKMDAQRQMHPHGSRNQPVHERRRRNLHAAAQRDSLPWAASPGTSNLRLDNSSRSASVSASATSFVTSYSSTTNAASSS